MEKPENVQKKTTHKPGTPGAAMNRPVPPYARLFFDHLYSEYQALKPSIKDSNVISILEEIHQKRQRHDLTWANIYTFDLTLVDVRPPESLIRKAYDARAKYRSIAGQKEYDEYLAAKPPDLSAIPFEPDAQPPEPSAIVERALRADITYLLSKFYLYYALLPLRESLRDQLTKNAVIVTGSVVAAVRQVRSVLRSYCYGRDRHPGRHCRWVRKHVAADSERSQRRRRSV
jgi:hypothetical protein